MSPSSSSKRAPPETPAPPPAKVEAQLEALLGSESLAGARRSREFLRFVVGETLEGHEHRLGGYTIGVEVFGRSRGFDPQTDPIVRVEAGRLRQRLEHYYLTEGRDDPVVIEIPKGGYVPRFSLRTRDDAATEPTPATAPEAREPTRHQRASRRAIAAVGLLLLVVLGFGSWRLLRPGPDGDTSAVPAPAPGTVRGAAILPFSYAADGDTHPFLDNGLVEELIAAVAALPEIEVVALRSAEQAARDGGTPAQIAEALGVQYVIRGNIRQQGERVRVTVTLIEAPTSRVRVSRRYDGDLGNVLDLQAQIARDVAQALVETVPPSFERQLEAAGRVAPEVLALFHEATTLCFPPSDPVRLRLAEEAYRRVIELAPEFAGGYAGLARVLAFRSWWGLSEQPEADQARALETARVAVGKDPDSGWAQASLAITLHVAGDHVGALAAARRAPELAPSDPSVLAFSGLLRGYAGEVEAGIPLLQSAIRLDPLSVRMPWRNMAGQMLFHAGRYGEALAVFQENLRLGGPDNPQMSYYRAATLARLGREEEARREIEKAETFPYQADIRDFLSAFRRREEARELLDVLESLGVDPVASPAVSGTPS